MTRRMKESLRRRIAAIPWSREGINDLELFGSVFDVREVVWCNPHLLTIGEYSAGAWDCRFLLCWPTEASADKRESHGLAVFAHRLNPCHCTSKTLGLSASGSLKLRYPSLRETGTALYRSSHRKMYTSQKMDGLLSGCGLSKTNATYLCASDF